jgi:hypothetical protein
VDSRYLNIGGAFALNVAEALLGRFVSKCEKLLNLSTVLLPHKCMHDAKNDLHAKRRIAEILFCRSFFQQLFKSCQGE